MAIPTVAWLTQYLGTKVGIYLGLELATEMATMLYLQERDLDLETHDRRVRDESVQRLIQARNEANKALSVADQMQNQQLKRDIFRLSRQMKPLQDSIRFAEPVDPQNRNREGVKYINLVVLAESFAILENIRNITDKLNSNEETGLDEKIQDIRGRLRNIEKILDVRRMSIQVKDETLMNVISDSSPELYENVRGMATVLFKADEMKAPRFFKGRYHEKLKAPVLELTEEMSKGRGPILSLAELVLEFRDRYTMYETSNEDIEKAVTKLVDEGLLESLEFSDKGYKIIKLKPLRLTDSFQQVLTVVSSSQEMMEQGVSSEDIVQVTGLLPEVSHEVLEDLCKEDIAWKHESKYYFPGLSESANTVKQKELAIGVV